MIPAAFDYVRPASLDDALAAIGQSGSKVIAGGQSLLPLLKMRLASAERLVDIGRLDELRGVSYDADGGVRVGALTTYAELIEATRLPWVREALEGIGDVQVRNRGTVGGAIAHCDPASDMPAILLALDGEVVLRSARGERVVPVADFFTGAFTTVAEPDELVVELRRGPLPKDVGGAYRSLDQPASGYSMVGVAAVLGGSGTFDHVRVAITGVGDHPYRALAVEEALAGTDCSPERIAAAAAHATDGVTVNSDIHADREYRTAMTAIYVGRALDAARARSA